MRTTCTYPQLSYNKWSWTRVLSPPYSSIHSFRAHSRQINPLNKQQKTHHTTRTRRYRHTNMHHARTTYHYALRTSHNSHPFHRRRRRRTNTEDTVKKLHIQFNFVRRSSFVVRRSSFVVRRSSFVVRRHHCTDPTVCNAQQSLTHPLTHSLTHSLTHFLKPTRQLTRGVQLTG